MAFMRLALLTMCCTLLSGCFFIFIPGSVVGAVSDSITGDVGEHCVSVNTQVGDVVPMMYGGKGRVKSISGKSVRCTNPENPMRALIAPM